MWPRPRLICFRAFAFMFMLLLFTPPCDICRYAAAEEARRRAPRAVFSPPAFRCHTARRHTDALMLVTRPCYRCFSLAVAIVLRYLLHRPAVISAAVFHCKAEYCVDYMLMLLIMLIAAGLPLPAGYIESGSIAATLFAFMLAADAMICCFSRAAHNDDY